MISGGGGEISLALWEKDIKRCKELIWLSEKFSIYIIQQSMKAVEIGSDY